ncbi:similar to An03g03680 [Aspergillus luchuensis]|uniref:Similar to An03g03680 n=1 Tax=Aspergillus kawachii TaxID=1069201 RepID=A0A146G0W7_ASPKA|nr:similar to An03g03680 [Aspergillus luchuensis IFO 4308]GAT31275.1 similar to An03g03680 [Aspergillus luchuensis]
MWFNLTTNQKAFALASLLLTPGALAAAIPPREINSDLTTPSFVAGVPINTHVPTTGADESLTSDPEVGVTCPTCDKDGNPKSIWEIIASGQPNAAPRSVDEDPSLTERDDIDANDINSDLQEEDTLSGPSDDDVAPSKTTRQPSTEVKRAAKVTGDAKYKKLKEALGKTPEVGQGYAIKIRSERARIAGKKAPDHYLIAAGYVTERKEGGVTYLKFESGCWDIQLDGKKIVFTDRGASSWYEWSETKMEVLGKIRSGVDNTEVERYGEQIAAKMNKKGYNTLFNNCRDFVLKLYAEIKA